jgi:hypothetical protein
MNAVLSPQEDNRRRLLHVGCGMSPPEKLPAIFQSPDWREIRMDIDERVKPDVVGSITDMQAITDASVDAIWSSHNLEHVNSFEVPKVLAEFLRVLKADGFVLLTLPDLRAVARRIADDQLTEPLYISASGPISPLDIVFGHQASMAAGNGYMAHRTGFTARSLGQSLIDAGFAEVRVHEGQHWDLWAVATMPQTPETIFEQLAVVLT